MGEQLGLVPYHFRERLGFSCWPAGLNWFLLPTQRNRLTGRLEARFSYTIKAKGRSGARGRQRLMAYGRYITVRAPHA